MTTLSITHRDYTRMLPLWTKVRDVQSEEAVKAKGVDYLPKLESQEDGSVYGRIAYEKYLQRAAVHGAAARTKLGLTGAVLRRNFTTEGVPDADLRILQDNAGRDFEPLPQLVMQSLGELVTVGRHALLVDNDTDPESDPYLLLIKAEDVTFWASRAIKGRTTPVLIVIRQTYEAPKPGDLIGHETEQKTEWRMLRLGVVNPLPPHLEGVPGAEKFSQAPSGEMVYWQEVWRELETGEGSTKTSTLRPFSATLPTKRGGRFWTEIPCDVVNAQGGITLDVEDPTMLALANIVLSHYRNSADKEWALHLTATPQPWASGFDVPESTKLVTGCGFAWVTPTQGANVQYLEFSGAGLDSIAKAMAEKEQQMAVQGSRMLEQQKLGTEAMGTVKLRHSGDRSVLSTIAGNCSTAFTRAIQRWLSWRSPAFETDQQMAGVALKLDPDFDSMPLDPAELQALTSSLQSGAISWETFVFNLKRGEMLPPGVTEDEERKRIQIGAPGRSRKEELAMLQTDAREGRITLPVYLEQVQALGMLQGVSVDEIMAELDAVAEARDEARMTVLRIEEERAAAAAGKPPADEPDGEKAKDEDQAA